MKIKDEISKDRKQFIFLCKNHKVKYLYAFGSSVSEKFDHEKSDTDAPLRNPFLRKSIDSTKVLIYDGTK